MLPDLVRVRHMLDAALILLLETLIASASPQG